MTPIEFQQWLGEQGRPVTPDGQIGRQTRTATIEAFTNPCAPAVSDADLRVIADRLNCDVKQIKAVAAVESGGAGFDRLGRPKILFERHIFHRLTNGKYSACSFSMEKGGGYAEDSWDKLTLAIGKDVDAAFMATSWGKFQVLARNWQGMGYSSPVSMAYSTVMGEAAHYEMLARYVEYAKLTGALRRLSTNPQDNVAFARGYNGPGYAQFDYDAKLAKEMA